MLMGMSTLNQDEALKNSVFSTISQIERRVTSIKIIADENAIIDETSQIFEQIQIYCGALKKVIADTPLKINYLQLFQNDLSHLFNLINQYYSEYNINFFVAKSNVKEALHTNYPQFKSLLDSVSFNLNFFTKLNFLSSNIVAIGANGSGKTTLANKIRNYLNNSGIVIGAQKILLVPTFSGISNLNFTQQKINQIRTIDKTNKVTFETKNSGAYSALGDIPDEFRVLLENLLAEHNAEVHRYFDDIKLGNNLSIPNTKLDKLLQIWNTLISHRVMSVSEGVHLQLRTKDNDKTYDAYQMSDGEKVILYLVAQVLQAPQSSFIIIDEPEMYLHKTILNKLWDTLESERSDCIFIYLTHDLDFASQKTSAKKVWVKSFTYPDKWEIEEIPENEIPESLLMELLGSRKNILFCEGKEDSNDLKVYSKIFPNLIIKPVDSCTNVINYTKAFNQLENTNIKALGLIDSDFHTVARLQSLRDYNIYPLKVAEVENLFLSEAFLQKMSDSLQIDKKEALEKIKQKVLEEFLRSIELQVSNYISTKINNYFEESHVSKGNTLNEVTENFDKFTKEVKIKDWYTQRKTYLESISSIENYDEIIRTFNNKGIRRFVEEEFNLRNFTQWALKMLENDEYKKILLAYFPNEIKENN